MISSRGQLMHMLAEAAELEHNLLCIYLYAAFSLDCGEDSSLDVAELEATRRWRALVMKVCMEEMNHLSQVANLSAAVGARPHFNRPNFPVPPGYHPAGIGATLRRFDEATLQHFIFLERPEDALDDDACTGEDGPCPDRSASHTLLMPSAPDYATIGEFYQLLARQFRQLVDSLGESRLFVGNPQLQMHPSEIGDDDLCVVTDLRTALLAIEHIIEQGEGSSGDASDSHYQSFRRIRDEYKELLRKRPGFEPSRPVAENPVMREPVASDRTHVEDAGAAVVLDASNAIYALLLRCLAGTYETSRDEAAPRTALLSAAMAMMHAMSTMAIALTTMRASADHNVAAGMTFTMLRHTEGFAPGTDTPSLLIEELDRIATLLPRSRLTPATAAAVSQQLSEARRALASGTASP